MITRMKDVKRRYGQYPENKWKKNMMLKNYFEEKIQMSFKELLNTFSSR